MPAERSAPPPATLAKSWLVAITLAIFIVGAGVSRTATPLAGAHFDSPIYLYQAKRYAETELVQSYLRHAGDIAQQVRTHGWPASEAYPESFWRFMRFGHIALLGLALDEAGDPMQALARANLIWGLMLAAAVALVFPLSLALLRLLAYAATPARVTAAALSCLAWLASPIYRYLAANFLSETPALLLLSLGLLAWLEALNGRSRLLADLAGLCFAAVYVVRMESLWTAAAGAGLATLFALRGLPLAQLGRLVAVCATAGGTALALYAWASWPLTDPRLVGILRGVLIASRPTVEASYQALPVAGGLLWLGACAAPVQRDTRRLQIFGAALLLLVLLPRWNGLLAGTLQTRVLAEVLLPLAMLSTAGLAALLAPRTPLLRGLRVALSLALALCLLAVQPWTYAQIRALPGLWRIQSVKNLLVPASYERRVYEPAAIAAIARAVHGDGSRAILLRDATLPQEHLNLLRYFGAAYPHDADLALAPDVANPRSCSAAALAAQAAYEPVLFCTDYDADFLATARAQGWRLLALHETGAEGQSVALGRRVLVAGPYTLYALEPGAR